MSDRIVTIDDISIMTDEDLDRRCQSLNGYLSRERNRGNRHLDLELEYCYLYRETEIRNRRRESHLAWLNNGGHLNNVDQEFFN